MMNRIEKGEAKSFTETETGVDWKTVLISAHVESDDGPNLHILRSAIKNGAAYKVEAEDGIDDEHACASIMIVEDEVIIRTCCPDAIDSDATVLVSFDLKGSHLIELITIDSESDPPIVIRNIEDNTIVMLSTGDEPTTLHPGPWTIQGTAILDGRERTTLVQISDEDGGFD
jgi:hypothetical protein